MIQVKKSTILKLQQIIKEDYEKDLSFSEVSEIANTMVNYFDLLAKINHRNNNSDQEIN